MATEPTPADPTRVTIFANYQRLDEASACRNDYPSSRRFCLDDGSEAVTAGQIREGWLRGRRLSGFRVEADAQLQPHHLRDLEVASLR